MSSFKKCSCSKIISLPPKKITGDVCVQVTAETRPTETAPVTANGPRLGVNDQSFLNFLFSKVHSSPLHSINLNPDTDWHVCSNQCPLDLSASPLVADNVAGNIHQEFLDKTTFSPVCVCV